MIVLYLNWKTEVEVKVIILNDDIDTIKILLNIK